MERNMENGMAFNFVAMMISDLTAIFLVRESILKIASGAVGTGFILFGILLLVEIPVLTYTKRFAETVAARCRRRQMAY